MRLITHIFSSKSKFLLVLSCPKSLFFNGCSPDGVHGSACSILASESSEHCEDLLGNSEFCPAGGGQSLYVLLGSCDCTKASGKRWQNWFNAQFRESDKAKGEEKEQANSEKNMKPLRRSEKRREKERR
jgi:hypothetical protein